jgi:hypothetical protein
VVSSTFEEADMRELASALFWAVTGTLITFGSFALMTIGMPFLLVGLVTAAFGLYWLGTRGVWAITVGLGGVPAYIVLSDVLEAVGASGPPCTQEEGAVTIAAPSGAGESATSSCSPAVPDGYIVVLAFFGLIALSGPAVRLVLLVRGRPS